MSQLKALSTSTDWPAHALPEDWIKSLFNQMALAYGNRFTDMWRGLNTTELKRHWAVALATLTDEELIHGVGALKMREWPPMLPEFIKMCRPVMDPVVAYHEALEQGGRRERGEDDSWSSPAVFWAWRKIGQYDFSRLAYAILKPRWEAALAAEMAKDAHPPVPPQLVALPAPGKATTSVARAHQMLNDFKRNGIKRAVDVELDGKRWAHLIIARHAGGEVLPIASLENAQKALGLR